MRYSRTLIPTIKEVPSDAEIISHQLMLRAGLMRKVASGTYAYLPAGWRVLLKIMAIVRQEMDAAGALDCTMPMVQPYELWQKTGRDVDYGETLGQFIDRHGRKNVLSPTAEEVMTFVAAGEINSYKQLPINLYQINLKYRDEFRPRFGVLRSREFIMKDAYSFDADEAMLEKSYRTMYNAYCRVFAAVRAGICHCRGGNGRNGRLRQPPVHHPLRKRRGCHRPLRGQLPRLEHREGARGSAAQGRADAGRRAAGCPHAPCRQHRSRLRVPQGPARPAHQDADLFGRRQDRRGPGPRRSRGQSRKARAGRRDGPHRAGKRSDDRDA